jgi:hypothetical protein
VQLPACCLLPDHFVGQQGGGAVTHDQVPVGIVQPGS